MPFMQCSLASAWRKSIFLAAVVLLASLYFYLAGIQYVAWRHAQSEQPEQLKRAAALVPGSAEYQKTRGDVLLYVDGKIEESIQAYDRALELNPHAARTWLALASAHLIAGDLQGQVAALERAMAAEPTKPDIAWNVANHYLVAGEIDKGLKHFRTVVEHGRGDTPRSALELCWRATRDSRRILEHAVPPTPRAYLQLLDVLVAQEERAAALDVWKRIIEMRQPFEPKDAFSFLHFLVAQRSTADFVRSWNEMSALAPRLKDYQPRQNLVVNGGFELELLNGGLDWQKARRMSNVLVAVDTGEFRSGTRSLAVNFTEGHAPEVGYVQFVPVRPGTEYVFSAFMKSDELLTSSGPRAEVADAYTGERLFISQDLLGTIPWREHQGRFTTGPATDLLVIRFTRERADRGIRGRVWIDDVSLVHAPAEGSD